MSNTSKSALTTRAEPTEYALPTEPDKETVEIQNTFVPFHSELVQGEFMYGHYGIPNHSESLVRSTYPSPYDFKLLPDSKHNEPIFVVGITYWDDDEYQFINDTQRSITGRFEFIRDRGFVREEYAHEAAVRELQEELGFTCDIDAFSGFNVNKDKTWYTFAVCINALEPFNTKFERPSVYFNHRRSNKKVQIYIYGTLCELEVAFKLVDTRIYNKAEENIAGACFLRVDQLDVFQL